MGIQATEHPRGRAEPRWGLTPCELDLFIGTISTSLEEVNNDFSICHLIIVVVLVYAKLIATKIQNK